MVPHAPVHLASILKPRQECYGDVRVGTIALRTGILTAWTGEPQDAFAGWLDAWMQNPQRFLYRDAEDVQVAAVDLVDSGLPNLGLVRQQRQTPAIVGGGV
jgi:hypothetical protein